MILAGSTAIVTGAARRIGRAIALRLAEEGVHVGVHYGNSETEAQDTVREIRSRGVRAAAVAGDLNDPLQAATQVDAAIGRELGPAKILINSAAIFEAGTLASTSADDFDRHVNINLKSPFFLSQAFVKQLPADRDGAIINLLDWRAQRPPAGHIAYTIAKAGLLAQTKVLAQELGPRIRVNGIAPGAILPGPGDSQESFQSRAAKNPLHRTGSPEAIADAVVFLLRSDFITGEILHITGGEEL